MLRCFSTDPACPRVVPKAEKKIFGGGVMFVKVGTHVPVSVLI